MTNTESEHAECPPPRHRSRPQPQDHDDGLVENRWRDLLRRRSRFPLTPELDLLNNYASFHSRGTALFNFTRERTHRILARYLCRLAPKSHKAVLDAIAARTLGFGKYVEQITRRQFLEGVVGPDGKMVLDDYGCPVFAGLAISERTLTGALTALVNHRLVERFEFTNARGRFFAYMPFHRSFLVTSWAYAIGRFPGREGNRRLITGECGRVLDVVNARWPWPPLPVPCMDITHLVNGDGPDWTGGE